MSCPLPTTSNTLTLQILGRNPTIETIPRLGKKNVLTKAIVLAYI